jgi:hypothetical protein
MDGLERGMYAAYEGAEGVEGACGTAIENVGCSGRLSDAQPGNIAWAGIARGFLVAVIGMVGGLALIGLAGALRRGEPLNAEPNTGEDPAWYALPEDATAATRFRGTARARPR